MSKLIHVSPSFDLDYFMRKGMSKEQVIQLAISDAFRSLAARLRLATYSNETLYPFDLRIEAIEEGWDLQVKLYLEEPQDAVS